MTRRIETEPLAFDNSGAPFSARYGDVYASRDGALGQARHVFLGGNDLPRRWAGRDQFVILETGFGLGTNFLATWQAWRADPARPRRLHFVSVEKHPLAAADLRAAAPPEVGPLAGELLASWPMPIAGLHTFEFEGGGVVLTLALGDARGVVPQLALGADAFFLDGFAPARNPQMWDAGLIKCLARLARPGATLATYTSAHAVREALVACGFEVESRPGFGAKREMIAARFAPRWRVRRHEPPPVPIGGQRSAIVIGAGLAGSACVHALARRGWRVTLLERGAGPASGASALPWGLAHPHITPDDNALARLARAGFLWGGRALIRMQGERGPTLWDARGVFEQSGDPAQASGWQRALAANGFPPAFAAWHTREQAAQALGVTPRRDGLWFGGGAIASPSAICRAMLVSAGTLLDARFGADVWRLRQDDGQWSAFDARGDLLATAPVAVVASALDAARLLQLQHAPAHAVRGRVTWLESGALAGLRAGLAGDGYALRAPDGRVGVGATYETPLPGEDAPLSDEQAHQGNLARLARLLDQPVGDATAATTEPVPAGIFDGLRCVSHDRMPMAGAVADEAASRASREQLRGAHLADLSRVPGLYCCTALGSRGLTLAPLLGELIAAQIAGEPWPIERDLAAAVDPGRFLLKALRKGRPV